MVISRHVLVAVLSSGLFMVGLGLFGPCLFLVHGNEASLLAQSSLLKLRTAISPVAVH